MAKTAQGEGSFLPDFCSARVIFLTILIAQLLAIALSLHSAPSAAAWLPELAMTSLFVQWVVLGSAAALCMVRARLVLGTARTAVLSWSIVVLVTAVVAELSWFLLPLIWERPLRGAPALNAGHWYFFLHTVGTAGIIAAIYLRHLYVNWQRNHYVKVAAQSRLRALQARIRPHFLFNCLNSIAAMISERPDDAEQAVVDLASLIRVSLKDGRDVGRLEEELALCRKYLRIEATRLGKRLQLRWETEAVPGHAHIPQLLLQPLLENAIYHGIETLEAGGLVHIKGELAGAGYRIRISNPRGTGAWSGDVLNDTGGQDHRKGKDSWRGGPNKAGGQGRWKEKPGTGHSGSGHSLGTRNIQQRLQAIYGPSARLDEEVSAEQHVVTVSIPVLNLDDDTLDTLAEITRPPRQ